MTLDSSTLPRFVKDGVLLPGDIVLTTTSKPLSAAIRKFTKSDISHAMLCVAELSVIDSTGDGVHARNLQWMGVQPGCAFHVLRPVEPLSTAQVARAIRYARERIAMPYTKSGAVQSLRKTGVVTHHQFCSRLVAQAYRAAGVHLVADADRCTPAELLRSPLLVEVADVLREVSAEEAAARAAHGDRTQLMRDAIDALVNGARALSPTIETPNDIDQYLMGHPQADAPMCELVRTTGYLEVWHGEASRNPWQFDADQMETLPHDVAHRYCMGVVVEEQLGPSRFITNRAGYQTWHAQTGLKYFGRMRDLYTDLASMHAQRVETVTAWLLRHGYLEPVETRRPRPHTSEWFAAADGWDPRQAAMTRHVIQMAGSDEVCSVCGDEPANDYELRDPAPAGPGTIRLCDDCYAIRSPDEPMAPFPADAG